MKYEQLTWATIMLPTDEGFFKIEGEGVAEQYIEQLLRYGSNTENARQLIVAEFSKCLNDYTEFLKETYHGGFGIQIGEDIISVEYGDEVIFRKGEAEKTLTWPEIQSKISALLDEGIFAFQEEIDGAFDCEIKELARLISYVIMDTEIDGIWEDFGIGYPAIEKAVEDRLRTKPMSIAASLDMILTKRRNGEEPVRFPRLYKIDNLFKRAVECKLQRKTYKSILDEETVKMVITDYEIDRALGAGSGVSGGKQRIKVFFESETDKRKRQEFLKNEYGIGGHSHAVSGANHSNENHDGKGIELVKGDCRVMMNWAQVERRIDKIIKENRY